MTYIALTIGPIYKTIQNTKKPKELWSGSYFFSYLMKEFIRPFRDRHFVTPYIKDDSIFKERDVGVFHDRFIFEAKEGDLQRLEEVIAKVLEETAEKLGISYEALREYLQLHYTSFDTDDNPILKISPLLDTQELFFQTSQKSDDVIAKIKSKENFMLKGKKIVDDLKELAYNNYICIVHADGDNMSKVIEDQNKIADVSKNLFEYCMQSSEMIKAFGGQTIFAGGDDLLFFAPVVGKGEDSTETIFELCDRISKDFESRFDGVATLSFGISINYVKFPLYEALENSRELLFAKAKKEPKNSVAFRLTKHSGQSFETIVHKGNKEVYSHFIAFSDMVKTEENMDTFLDSIHHKLDTYKTTIDLIGNDKTQLKNFFDNYFNEDEHKKYKDFFDTLVAFIHRVYEDESIADKHALIYATLRFVKFVKGDKS